MSRKVAALSLTYSTHTHLVQNSVKNTPLHNLPYFSNKKTHRPKNWYVVKKEKHLLMYVSWIVLFCTFWSQFETMWKVSRTWAAERAESLGIKIVLWQEYRGKREGGPKVLLLSTFIDFVNDIEVTVSRFYVQGSILDDF